MKLCLMTHSLAAGGAERCAATLANHWAAAGWEIVLVTMTSRADDFYALHPAVRRVALELDAASAGPWQAIVNTLRRVRALRRLLVREKPEATLALMATCNCLLALAAMGLPGIAVGSERIHPPRLPLGRAWELARRLLYGRLDAVVCLTSESAAWVRRQTTARRTAVIPNGLVWPVPSQPPVLEISREAPASKTLLAVGRLARQKGFDQLLQAFVGLAGQFPDWRLVILGEGPDRPMLEALRARLGLEDRVHLPGVAGNVGDWYAAADLFVLSSRFEGFPNTLLEALAAGLPCVSVDCETGPRDILRHEVDGLLAPQDDPAALAAALARLMADAALRQRFAARAVEARERFGLARVAGQWETLFEDLRRPRGR